MVTEKDFVSIVLTNREFVMGAECGVMRNLASILSDREPWFPFDDGFGWNTHIEGACGEVAAAKAMGRFWSPTVNAFTAPDIGAEIQVRTRSEHDYELYVRPKDNPAHLFVLVTGKAPAFIVRGYYPGDRARRDEWKKQLGSAPPSWFVPQADLWPISDLVVHTKAVSRAPA